jgi:hypothetical protein
VYSRYPTSPLKVIVACFVIVLTYCSPVGKYDLFLLQAGDNRDQIEKAINYFENNNDPSKLRALLILLEYASETEVETPLFLKSGVEHSDSVPWNSLPKDKHALLAWLQDQHARIILEKKIAIQSVSADYLIQNIESAFQDFGRYSWNKDVPFDVFLDYLLPYNVYQNNPDDWRALLLKKYAYIRDSMAAAAVEDGRFIYKQVVEKELAKEVAYTTDFLSLSNYASYKEIMYSGKGECNRLAYVNTLALRAMGIPATIDIVPFWGTENGGHADVAFWQHDKLFLDDYSRFSHAAKVFRYTIRRHKKRSDLLHLYPKYKPFISDFMSNEYLTDVTSIYKKTIDLTYKLPDSISCPLVFICVRSFGKWCPLEVSEVKKRSIRFNKMGCNVLYQISTLNEQLEMETIGAPFIVDSSGHIKYMNADDSVLINMKLSRYNLYSVDLVKKGHTYFLDYLENTTWKRLGPRKCVADGEIIFENVPSNTIYELQDDLDYKHKSRFFTYHNNSQVWW